MPFFFVFVGVLLIVTGVKDTHEQLGKQLVKDFTGEKSFWTWVVAFGAIGAIGYVDKLKPLSNAFMVLVLLAMVLNNSKGKDIITLVSDGLNNPKAPERAADAASKTAEVKTLSRADFAVMDDAVKAAKDFGSKQTTVLQDAQTAISTGAKLLAIFGF